MNSLNPVDPRAKIFREISGSEAHMRCNTIKIPYVLGHFSKNNIFEPIDIHRANEYDRSNCVLSQLLKTNKHGA